MWKLAIAALRGYALTAIAGLSGVPALIAKIALKYFIKFLEKLAILVEQKVVAKKALENYDKVLQNPNSTADEIRDAASDFLK